MRIVAVPLAALAAYVAYHRIRRRPVGSLHLGRRPPLIVDVPPYGYNFASAPSGGPD